MYLIKYDRQAAKDIKTSNPRGLTARQRRLLRENPFEPPCEALVGNLAGLYSRRINIQHRLVYEVFDEEVTVDGIKYKGTVKIIRMWTHYDSVR